MCKADEVSLRRGYQGKFKGDFVPRWKKREQKKHKVVCCLPSCKEKGRRKCTFASVSDIYTACGVSSVLYLRILLFLFVNSITNVFTNT